MDHVNGGSSIFDDDIAFLRAFDAAGALLDEIIAAGDGRGPNPFSNAVTSKSSRDIAYVLAGGLGGAASHLDNLAFRNLAVPEPATLALFGLGLGSLGVTRRRKAA